MRPAERLRAGREFDDTYREGTVFSGPFFVLRVRPNECGHPRWGLAVGKRLARHATLRNNLRRRMRAAMAKLPPLQPADIVVTARARALDSSVEQLAAELERQCIRADLTAPGGAR